MREVCNPWIFVPEVLTAYKNGKDFRGVDLSGIYFRPSLEELLDLTDADFRGCDLSSTEFENCNLSSADFSGANLEGCNIVLCKLKDFAELKGANNIRDIKGLVTYEDHSNDCFCRLYTIRDIRTALDTSGKELIGYKAVARWNNRNCYHTEEIVIAKLLIPVDAKRIIFKDDKCRCDKVKTLDIYDLNKKKHYNSAHSFIYDNDYFAYTVGCESRADSFSDNALCVCGHGIHFFLTEEEAINYGKHYS